MKRAGPAAALVAALVLGAACAAPGPTSPTSAATPRGSASPARSGDGPDSATSAAPAPSTGTRRLGELGESLAIERLDTATSDSVLEFASTGSAIIFSSNLAADAARDAAPDLWRITPGAGAQPELVWRNPARGHALTRLAGDLDLVAFVDMPVTGERAWALRLLDGGGEPLLLDEHPGNEDVSGLVPSIAVAEGQVAWTAFDRGPTGPVSQLLVARAPDWQPRVIAERDAAKAELWFPSLHGTRIVYTEVVYAPDRSSDERFVHVANAADGSQARRLDTSGLATMSLLADETVIWKEGTPGFSMFNWGHLVRHDLEGGETRELDLGRQESVNSPSAGSRFVAWYPYDTSSLDVYDLVRDEARTIERYPPAGNESILRAHVAGDLIAWLYVVSDPDAGSRPELRYAILPHARQP